MKPIALFFGLALVALFGCATAPDVSMLSPSDIQSSCSVTRDDFAKITFVHTIDVTIPLPENVFGNYTFRLLATKKDGGAADYCLVLHSWRTFEMSWAFWQSAADADGKEFTMVQENTRVDSIGVNEVYSVDLPREYLDGIRAAGINLRLYGKNSTADVGLQGNFVDGFLKRCDEVFGASVKAIGKAQPAALGGIENKQQAAEAALAAAELAERKARAEKPAAQEEAERSQKAADLEKLRNTPLFEGTVSIVTSEFKSFEFGFGFWAESAIGGAKLRIFLNGKQPGVLFGGDKADATINIDSRLKGSEQYSSGGHDFRIEWDKPSRLSWSPKIVVWRLN